MGSQNASNNSESLLSYSAVAPTTALYPEANDNDTVIVTSNGSNTGSISEVWKFDQETGTWNLMPSGGSCPGPMTRAALRSLRTSGGLNKDCHYVITNPNAQGTLDVQEIILHAVNANTLSMQAGIFTSHDTLAWNGTYDIDLDDVLEVTDNLDNHVKHNVSIINFPWGKNTVYDNTVIGGRIIDNGANRISGNTVGLSAVLTSSGGSQYNNTIEENATATFTGASSLSNTFEQDSAYTQVGTGYIRYSKVGTNSTVVNGNTNITNKQILDTQMNTTGSTGNISGGTFDGAVLNALQNITSLTLNNLTMGAGSSISATGAARLYCNGNKLIGTGRILVSSGKELDVNYGGCNSNSGYINVTDGKLTVNNCNLMNGYIQHSTPGTNIVSERTVSDGYIRFLNSSTGNRVYYGEQSAYIDVSGTSTGCFIYYSGTSSNGKIYVQDSVNARLYHSEADSNATIRSRGNTGTHYMYYCKAMSGSTLEMLSKTGGRMYSITSMGTAIARFQGAGGGNRYYSVISAYYYALISATGGTRSGLFGMGRRSLTVTNPTTGTPYASGASRQNFS